MSQTGNTPGSPMPGQPNLLHSRYPKTIRLGRNIHNVIVHRLSFRNTPQTGNPGADLAQMFDEALEEIFAEVIIIFSLQYFSRQKLPVILFSTSIFVILYLTKQTEYSSIVVYSTCTMVS